MYRTWTIAACGEKSVKKKKKKKKRRNWNAMQQTTTQTHTIKAICRLDYTFYSFPAFLFLIWFFLQHSVFLLWVESCLIRLVDGAVGLLACLTSIWPKWVITHKNQTIQLVGPVLKQYSLLATRASEARFRGPKSSLWGSVSACLVARFHVACPHGTRVSETRVTRGHATWNSGHVDLVSLRLGLLKVKPSLRHSISNRNILNLTLSPISLSLISQTLSQSPTHSLTHPLLLSLSQRHRHRRRRRPTHPLTFSASPVWPLTLSNPSLSLSLTDPLSLTLSFFHFLNITVADADPNPVYAVFERKRKRKGESLMHFAM